jgi:hypothetical protein
MPSSSPIRRPTRYDSSTHSAMAVSPSGGQDVGGAHAGVLAAMPVEVDQLGGAGDAAEGSLRNRVGLAGEGEDQAVVGGVGVLIQDVDARDGLGGGSDGRDDRRPAALAEIGDALDEAH